MASFRDRYNPETIHFPAGLTSKFLILVGWGVCVLSAVGCVLTHQPFWRTLIELVFLSVVCGFLLFCWPQDLRIELKGVATRWLMGRRTFIEWGDVTSAKPFFRQYPFGLRSEKYIIQSKHGVTIMHTERHPDRERFVFELRRHGVEALDAYDD